MNIYHLILEPFIEYGFMRRALAACAALSVSGAPLGIFLVLRRMTLVGDAMSHAILPGVSIAFMLFGLSVLPMTIGGLIAGMIIALIAGSLTRFTRLKEDASFTGTYIISLSLGVLIISMKGSSMDLMHVLFGNVLAVDDTALVLITSISTISLLTLAAIYRGLIIECFDKDFLKLVKGRGGWIHQIFLGLVVLNLVCAFQALGTLMALGLMVLPAITSGFWTKNIDVMVILSILLALFSSFIGLVISYNCNSPTGPTIILTAGGFYIFSIFLGRYGSIRARILTRRHYTY